MATTNVIDVSRYQDPKQFDYAGAKSAGVQAMIIQLGHGHTQDPSAADHIANAKANGLKIAGYFYYEGTSGEVDFSTSLAQKLLPAGSYYFLDMEGNIGGDWQSQFYDFKTVWQTSGYRPGIYCSDSPYKSKFNNDRLVQDGVYRWIASYSYEPANYDIWQTGSKGGFGKYTNDVDHDFDKTGSIINGAQTPTQPTQPTQATQPVITPNQETGAYISNLVGVMAEDSETGIPGLAYSNDNGGHYTVLDTVYGRKYRQEDADRLWPLLEPKIKELVQSMINPSSNTSSTSNNEDNNKSGGETT